MKTFAHQRMSQRFQSEASVLLEDFRTRYHYNGTMYNFSDHGGYVESLYAPRPGRKIHIKVDGVPDVIAPHVYLAEIRWRKPLAENPHSYTYGVGVKYC